MTAQAPSQPQVNPGTSHLLAFVAECPAACPVCEYSLRGLTEPRCPECGAELQLQVGSPRLHVGGWALAMIGFALALGFDGVVSLIMMTALVLNPTTQWEVFGIVSLFLVLTGSMLAGLLIVARRKRHWTRRRLRHQWRTGIGIFLCVGSLHALVGAGFVIVQNW